MADTPDASAAAPVAAPEAAAPAAPVAAAPEAMAAPIVEAPAAAPAVEVAAPLVEAAPEVAPAADPLAEPVVEPVAEAPVEAAPAEEPKPEADGDKLKLTAPEPIKYEDWKVPEGLALQPEQTSALNNILGKWNLSQEAGQEIIDYGGTILKAAQERMAQQQIDAFADTRKGWVKEFEKGAGNRRETVLTDARNGLKDIVPNDKARAALVRVLNFTGAGDHPALINAFAALGKRQRERSAPGPSVPQAPTTTAAERRYARR